MIFIRADANPHIGMGHIMRCLSLADVLRVASQDVTFVLADENVSAIVQNRGYKTIILNSSYNMMDKELNLWPTCSPSFIIVDSYYVTNNYMKEINSKACVVYIDDVASFAYPVDVLVDYNAYGPDLDYHNLYQSSDEPVFYLGVSYAPLREMFRNIPKRIQREKVSDVLFSTGGSDDLHIALKLLKHKPKDFTYHLLIGAMNRDKEEIKLLAESQPNIVLHENVSDMRSLISSCDIAVSAAGSTLYEICACGVPLITYISADNQIPGAEAFEKIGIAINCGDLRNDENGVKRILAAIDDLARDYKRRTDTGYRMQKMIDGNGAARLAKAILDLGMMPFDSAKVAINDPEAIKVYDVSSNQYFLIGKCENHVLFIRYSTEEGQDRIIGARLAKENEIDLYNGSNEE